MSPETSLRRKDAEDHRSGQGRLRLLSVRAGPTPRVLDRIIVEYYGTPTPLNQVAAISSPDPRTLMIQPWDGIPAQGHREGHPDL